MSLQKPPAPAASAAPNGESIVHVRADSDSMLEEMFAVVQQKNPPAQGGHLVEHFLICATFFFVVVNR